jgi:hypothetical protein
MLKKMRATIFLSMLSIAGSLGAAPDPPARAALTAPRAIGAATSIAATAAVTRPADVPAPPVLDAPPSLVRDLSLAVTGAIDSANTDSLFLYRVSATDTAVVRAKMIESKTFRQTIMLREGDNEIWAVAQDKSRNMSGRSNTVNVRYETMIARIYPEVFRAPDVFEIDLEEIADEATVDLFTVNGERVVHLRKGGPATQFRIDWNLTNGDGEQVRNGPYLAVITVAGRNGMTVEKHFIAVVR